MKTHIYITSSILCRKDLFNLTLASLSPASSNLGQIIIFCDLRSYSLIILTTPPPSPQLLKIIIRYVFIHIIIITITGTKTLYHVVTFLFSVFLFKKIKIGKDLLGLILWEEILMLWFVPELNSHLNLFFIVLSFKGDEIQNY